MSVGASSRRGRARCSLLLAWFALGLLGCFERERPSGTRVSVEFGIFYGGQVQEREQLPLEVDATKQNQGFRLHLDPAPRDPLEIRWELGMPGAGRARRDSRGRLARPRKVVLGQARWRSGEVAFEQPLPFSPGDPLGLWSIRVLVGSRVVLDRPFLVYDAQERSRKTPAPFEIDAGF